MPIILKCECGKTLKIDEKYRGRQAACPVCGKPILVAGPNEDTSASILIEPEPEVAVQPPPKAVPKPAPAPAEDANPFAVSPTSPTTRRRKRGLLPWVTAGCGLLAVVLSCCGGIGFGVYWFFLKPFDEDFQFVNHDVVGFYSVRVADILKSPSFKDQLGKLPARDREAFDKKLAEIDKKLGLTFTDLERVTFINRLGGSSATVLRTTKAMNKKKIFATFSAEKSEKKEGNATYYLLDRPNEPQLALHFVNDRLVLVTQSEASMKDFLNLMDKPATAPVLKRGIKLASSGSHTIVAATKIEAPIDAALFGAGLGVVPALRDMSGLIMTATIDQRVNFEVTGMFASSDQAARAKSEIEDAVQKAKGKPVPLGANRLLSDLLDSVAVTQSGAEVVARGKVDFPAAMLAQQIHGIRMQSPGQKQSRDNLARIARAINTYERVNGKFPAGGTTKTMSWRVMILPYLDDPDRIHEQIKMGEPWDSEHNRKFANKMPKVYQLPNKANDGRTYYQVLRGPESMFPDVAMDVKLIDLTDGPRNTLLVVEAAEPVQWMRSEDLGFRIKTTGYSGQSLGNHWGDDTFHAAFADDRVRRLPRSINPMTLQGMITRNGNEKIKMEQFDDNDPGGVEFDEP